MKLENTIIIAMAGNEVFANNLSQKTGIELGEATIRRFPDGESYVRIISDVMDKNILLVCTLFQPDDKFLPLYFIAQTAKKLGAKKIQLIAPYLAYMRQDIAFRTGESITSAHFAGLISSFVDSIITIDPHLHRWHALSEIYSIPNKVLHASTAISEWIKHNVHNPILIGPDSESEQWVADVAQKAEAPHIILQKERFGDREVKVSVPEVDKYKNHTPVLVDDIISTARTMIETVGHLKNAGMKDAICIGVHAIFSGNAYDDLKKAGVQEVITCNTIPHHSNLIDIAPMIIKALD